MERSAFSGLVAVVYFISNVGGVYGAETNFWNERRAQVKRYSSSSLLCQLPPIRAVGFTPSQSDPVSGGSPRPEPFTHTISRSDLTSAKTAFSRDASPDWLGSLVSSYGHVRDIHVSAHSDRPLMIHIQDIHGNVDAQKNIAHMIGALSANRGVT
ncbi:MAG: hypothetical protein KBG07_06955, partial [Elusimicrobia bacterium]|nr:hypothetical protein [Elusimicrobiota bacterium]